MGIVSGLVLFIIIWWTVLFAVLPWGVRTPETPEKGHATSAPLRPRLWRKAAITTAVAAVLWCIAYFIINSDWLPVRGG